jgi:3-phenylpropionate/trans-cinnamate dioxygenase ferredoxin subunit
MAAEISISLALSDVPQGGMHACMVGGRDIVVCRTRDGIYALDNICTHAYARLHEGRLRGTRLICPLHGASFDIRDGRVLGAPATRPLATHAASVVGDTIEISITPADFPQLRL